MLFDSVVELCTGQNCHTIRHIPSTWRGAFGTVFQLNRTVQEKWRLLKKQDTLRLLCVGLERGFEISTTMQIVASLFSGEYVLLVHRAQGLVGNTDTWIVPKKHRGWCWQQLWCEDYSLSLTPCPLIPVSSKSTLLRCVLPAAENKQVVCVTR